MTQCVTGKAAQSVVVKTIGERLKVARELCNMSLSIAAKRLGYANPSKLSKVENAMDTNSVPILLIVNAAQLYDVSVDYLVGLSDDWETRDARLQQRRVIGGYLLDAMELTRKKEMASLERLFLRTEVLATAVHNQASAAADIESAIKRVEEVNGDAFLELRAGSRLVGAIEKGVIASRYAENQLKKFHLELKLAGKISQFKTDQLGLDIE